MPMTHHQNPQDTQSAMKFASFHLAFNMWVGMGNREDGEPKAAWHGCWNACQAHQRMLNCTRFAQVLTQVGKERSHGPDHHPLPGQFSAWLWNPTEGMSLAGRVWEHRYGHSCLPHSMCRICSFLVYSTINCFVLGPLFWVQLSLELGLLVCFRSRSVSSACLPAWLTPSVPLPLSPQLPLRALPWTWATAVLLLCLQPRSDLLSVEQRGKVC